MTPALLGIGMTALVGTADAPADTPQPEPATYSLSTEIAEAYSAPAPKLISGLGPMHSVQLGSMASPFQRTQLLRSWAGGGIVFAGGVAGAVVGTVVSAFVPFASFLVVPMGAALGMHFLTDAGLGYEFLGGFIGFIVFLPVAVVTAIATLAGGLNSVLNGGGEEGLATTAFIGMGAILLELILLPTTGAYLAANLHHNKKAGKSARLVPMIDGERTGAAVSLRF